VWRYAGQKFRCTFYGTVVLYKVQGGAESRAAEDLTGFLSAGPGNRARTGMAEGIAGSRAPRHRQRPVASAMAMAGRDAIVPRDGRRFVGGPD